MRKRSFPCLLVIYAIFINSLAPFALAQEPSSAPEPETEKGLKFTLSEGAQNTPEIIENQWGSSADAENLSAADANEIFRRLPPMRAVESDKIVFNLRPGSLPPPKAGKAIPVKFPRVSVLSTNYKRLRVRLFSVKPEDFPTFAAWSETDSIDPGFGRLVTDKTVRRR